MLNPETVLKKMEEVRAETLRRLDKLTQEQLDKKPLSIDDTPEWSLGEVFMHLAIDEIYLREMIAIPLLEGIRPPPEIRYLPPPPPYGTKKVEIEFWFQRARIQTKRYFINWPENAKLELVHEGGLKEMNGLQWFNGFAGHELHHFKQIDRLISLLS